MKKLFATLVLATLCMGAFAQEVKTEDPVLNRYSVETNSFWSNWYIQANASWNVYYSNQEHGMGLSGNPFKGYRSTPSMSIAVGKWFTPGIGGRFKLYGFWGKTVNGDNSSENKMNHFSVHVQGLLNLVNLIAGYNPNRIYDLSAFLGAGIGHNITSKCDHMVTSAGLLNQFHVAKHWGVNVELGWIYGEDDYDGTTRVKNYPTESGHFWKSHDQHFYAELGVTYFINKVGWTKTPDVAAIKALSQAQIDALNAQLAEANAENSRLKALLAQKPKEVEKVVSEFASNPLSVFFNINKTQFASRKDLVDVKKLVEYAKEHNSTLLVRGYADSKTGNVPINQRLSEGRANRLADELVKMGISRDNIVVEPKGGVLDISPVSYNRRATVEILK